MTKRLNLNTPFDAEKLQNQSVADFTKYLKKPGNYTKPIEAKSNEIKSPITKRYVSEKVLFSPHPASKSTFLKNTLFPQRIVAK